MDQQNTAGVGWGIKHNPAISYKKRPRPVVTPDEAKPTIKESAT